MLGLVSTTLLGLAWLGTAALALQLFLVRRRMRETPRVPASHPGVSILKPLCGVDDGLEESLERFATLGYPNYELLLGVRDALDPAYPVALRAARRHPGRVRVIVQRGEPGLNPKVNQLVTLEARARHELLVISDSNTRVGPGYLEELVALFEDPEVACVTHPVVGDGEERLGSLLDNLHLGSAIGPGMIAAKMLCDGDLVLGKSMALRRTDLDALGGFRAVKDHLAEDYVLGRAVGGRLGKRVALARATVINHSQKKRVSDFARRYVRWSVIHRTAVSLPTYFAEGLLNPTPLAVLGAASSPSGLSATTACALVLARVVVDLGCARALRGRGFGVKGALAVPLKDGILFAAFCVGLVKDTVSWRGNSLRVTRGSLLVPCADRPRWARVTGRA